MVDFWLNSFDNLLNTDNFRLSTNTEKLNVLSLVIMVYCIVSLNINRKNTDVIKYSFISLSLIIMINYVVLPSNVMPDKEELEDVGNPEITVKLLKNAVIGDNKLYVNMNLIKKGDVILISDTSNRETKVVNDIMYTNDNNSPVVSLLTNIENNYSMLNTVIKIVSSSSPKIASIRPITDTTNISEIGNYDLYNLALDSFPKVTATTGNRTDSNLELGTYGPPTPTYEFQGPPNGPLKCRMSTLTNPMGTVNITEYDAPPTMYGTCNVGETVVTRGGREVSNDYLMTDNFEKTVSMRTDDLLFHKGNSQSRFGPMAVDTIPDNQTAFANFCYRSPTNLINPKYASIFVNDPEKYRLVAALAQATGTENGGGGGGGGRGN